MHVRVRKITGLLVASVLVGSSLLTAAVAMAATVDEAPFAIQVTPSPLILSVKPGEHKVAELSIRNSGTRSESLKVTLRPFKVNDSGNVDLLNGEPSEVKDWVAVDTPQFNVKPGEWFTEKITLNTPQDTGFSYNFAVVIARSEQPVAKPGQQTIIGSVAVFTLVTVDRPGAVRKFSITDLQSDKRSYEFLPASFSIKLKNDGNTIVQPVGNVFIQRSSTSQPITTLPLNPNGSYLLPGVNRTLSFNWAEGFPSYQDSKTADNAPVSQKLIWDWSKAQQFRFGKYVAKVVAVYNDGQRDVPVVSEVSFWVIPWKLLLMLFVTILILVVGVTVIIRKLIKLGKHARKSKKTTEE